MSTSGATSHAAPARDLPDPGFERRRAIAATLLIIGVAFAAYWPSLSAPFIFADLPAIAGNPTIRQFRPLADVLSPARATDGAVAVSPVVNLSLALNYALGGLDVRGYRVFNVMIHALSGALLLGILRRTLCAVEAGGFARGFSSSIRGAAFPLALGCAAVWMLHPLQTEAVAGIIRRTELLAGLFYFLALYAFIRGVDPGGSRAWLVAAVLACALGVATNGAAATAPLLLLLYDRTFVARTFAEALRRRRTLYVALATTWLLLAWLAVAGAAGGAGQTSAWDYVITQFRAFTDYLKLAIWPHPLVLDYGIVPVRSLARVWWHFSVVLVLLAGVAIALWRRPVLGFVGVWFLVLLGTNASIAASSDQIFAEHRMYLPLASPIVLLVAGVHRWVGRGAMLSAVALALGYGGLTFHRSGEYRTALGIWGDTVAKAPGNARAHHHFANALSAAGRPAEAIAHYEIALRLEPRMVVAHRNLAGVLLQLGREEAAVALYEAALRLEPDSAGVHADLAAALVRLERMPEAVKHYEAAAQLGMRPAEERRRFGRALAEVGRMDEALVYLREALQLDPADPETHVILGMVLAASDRGAEALRHFTTAVTLQPNDAEARRALADALVESGRPVEAVSHYEAALRLHPDRAGAIHTSLGNALVMLGRIHQAIAHYEEALRLDPGNADARTNLTRVRAAAQRRGLIQK